jgi:hypothetical protein
MVWTCCHSCRQHHRHQQQQQGVRQAQVACLLLVCLAVSHPLPWLMAAVCASRSQGGCACLQSGTSLLLQGGRQGSLERGGTSSQAGGRHMLHMYRADWLQLGLVGLLALFKLQAQLVLPSKAFQQLGQA